jgi:hypothetical protein
MLGSIDKKKGHHKDNPKTHNPTSMKWKRKYRQLQGNRQSDYTGKHIFFLVEEANGARLLASLNPIDGHERMAA